LNAAAKWVLGVAGSTALLAGGCCALPLLLVSVGVTGAWMASLRGLRPYSTALLVVSASLTAYLWLRVVRRRACNSQYPGTVFRLIFWSTVALLIVMGSSALWAPLFY
jgi:mercuric ion transport protein